MGQDYTQFDIGVTRAALSEPGLSPLWRGAVQHTISSSGFLPESRTCLGDGRFKRGLRKPQGIVDFPRIRPDDSHNKVTNLGEVIGKYDLYEVILS